VKFVATEKVKTTNIFPPSSFVAVVGSDIRDPRFSTLAASLLRIRKTLRSHLFNHVTNPLPNPSRKSIALSLFGLEDEHATRKRREK
jgi:hypothetical protein